MSVDRVRDRVIFNRVPVLGFGLRRPLRLVQRWVRLGSRRPRDANGWRRHLVAEERSARRWELGVCCLTAGALTAAFAPNGRTLAVSRSRYTSPAAPSANRHQEIWLIGSGAAPAA